jgi:hypothetical protein
MTIETEGLDFPSQSYDSIGRPDWEGLADHQIEWWGVFNAALAGLSRIHSLLVVDRQAFNQVVEAAQSIASIAVGAPTCPCCNCPFSYLAPSGRFIEKHLVAQTTVLHAESQEALVGGLSTISNRWNSSDISKLARQRADELHTKGFSMDINEYFDGAIDEQKRQLHSHRDAFRTTYNAALSGLCAATPSALDNHEARMSIHEAATELAKNAHGAFDKFEQAALDLQTIPDADGQESDQ